MKKVIIAVLMFVFTFGLYNTSFINVSALQSTCSDEPTVYSVGSSKSSISQNEPFTLGITFYNECNHQIKAVKVNGVVYGSDTNQTNHISSQGYTSTILPGAYKAYLVQIPMIYDQSMGTSFTITDFIYVYWEYGVPEEHLVAVNEDFPDSIMDTTGPGDLPGTYTTEHIRLEYDENGLVVYNEVTGASERWEFDAIFTAAMYVNGVGDLMEFYVNPGPNAYEFIRYALDNAQDYSSLGDFASDVAYDIILNDDSLLDLVLNKATETVIEEIQLADPNYVFPGAYMWLLNEVTGEYEFIEILTDNEGNPVLDNEGNPIPDPGGNTAGDEAKDFVLDPDSVTGSAIINFETNMNEWLGVNWNWSGWIEYSLNNWGFILGCGIVIVLAVITFGFWWPILLGIINIIWTLIMAIFKFLAAISSFSQRNMERTLAKQAMKKRAKTS